MWGLATQSALIAIIISGATTIALLLRSQKPLYIRFGGFALSIGSYYLTALINEVIPRHALLQSLSIVAGGLVIIFTSSFFDALVGEVGIVGDKRRKKTYIAAVLMIVIGFTPFSQISLVQIALFVTTIILLGSKIPLLFVRAKKAESEADKKRVQYLAVAGTLAVLAFCIDFAAHLDWPLPPVGGLVMAVYLYFMSQALWTSRLLDLHELLGKALVFSCLTIILASVYGVLVIWTDSRAGLFWFNTLIASSLILILFEPIKAILEEQTTRYFFREHVTFARELRRAIRMLATIVELQQALEFVLNQIYENKRATHASIFILDIEGLGFVLQDYRGPRPSSYLEGKQYPVLFRYVMEGQKPILRQSVERRLLQERNKQINILFTNFESNESTAEDQALLEAMNAIHSELLIPLRYMGNVVGVMSLKDEKLSEAYAKDEIAVLSQIGEQLAITIQNSRVFNALKEKDRLASLGEMCAGLAHEIRNPLAAIKGAAQALDPKKVGKDEQELLQIVVEEVNRLNKVVSEFLDYAKPFRGTFSPMNVNQVIVRTLQLLGHDLKENIDVRLDLENGLSEISGDAEQLRQVLINLVYNARDAMGKNGILRISTRHVKENNSYVEICIQDSGPGISPKIKDKIFIPFFTTKQQGTGLGLSLCQRIIRDHGGNIVVRSVQNKGTSFIIQLPTSKILAMSSVYDNQLRYEKLISRNQHVSA